MFFNLSRAVFLIFLVFNSFSFFGQDVLVEVQGDVSDDDGNLSGVSLQVSQGSKIVNTAITDPYGKYSFAVPLGGDFAVVVSKPGYVSKRFTINTNGVTPERALLKFTPIGAKISLFKKLEGVDYSLLNQPLIKYVYNPTKENFEYDKGYLNNMLDALETVKAAEKVVKEKEKQKDGSYNTLIKEADKLFSNKDWPGAKSKYQEAFNYKTC